MFSIKQNLQSPDNPGFLDSVKLLDVFFAKHLSWTHHINYIAPRLSRVSIICLDASKIMFPHFMLGLLILHTFNPLCNMD